jgi:hypothetical protein
MDYTDQLSAALVLGNTVVALLLTVGVVGLFYVGLRTAEALT